MSCYPVARCPGRGDSLMVMPALDGRGIARPVPRFAAECGERARRRRPRASWLLAEDRREHCEGRRCLRRCYRLVGVAGTWDEGERRGRPGCLKRILEDL